MTFASRADLKIGVEIFKAVLDGGQYKPLGQERGLPIGRARELSNIVLRHLRSVGADEVENIPPPYLRAYDEWHMPEIREHKEYWLKLLAVYEDLILPKKR